MAQRYIFINRFFYPDHSATSQILADLAFYLADRAEEVHVITSRQGYENASSALARGEIVRGVRIHRLDGTTFGRRRLLGRGSDYLSFHISCAAKLARFAKRSDVVIAKTDPPLLSVVNGAIGKLIGYRTVNWLQDLYPEIATALGIGAADGWLGRRVAGLRNASLCRASLNVAIGEDMALKLQFLGIPPEKIAIVHNWADDEAITPCAHSENPLRAAWGLEGKFVVGYSGNLGRAHDVQTFLGTAERLRDHNDIVFLFLGAGHSHSDLRFEVRKRRLGNVVFKPYQERPALRHSLGVPDVHWLSLKNGLDGLILPSKFYGVAAAGRPIVVVGSADSEFARLVSRAQCGFHVGLGDSNGFARVITELAANPSQCAKLGQNARAMLDAQFTKHRSLELWHSTLRGISEVPAEDNPSLSPVLVPAASADATAI